MTFNNSNKYKKGSVRKKIIKAKYEYIEDLKEKPVDIVTIDPNKGNLVYCFDGETTLRYTQNERRKVSCKSKYRKIRKSVEEEHKGKSVKDYLNELSQCNSRTTSVEKFKEYLKIKNLMAHEYFQVYQKTIFRKLRLNSKINLKRSEDKFISKFKKTYGTEKAIVYGDWEERPSFLRGKEPTKGSSMRKLFTRAGYKVYLIDEFRTSKLCCHCEGVNQASFLTWKDPRPWKQGIDQKVWGLLRCTNGQCRRVQNRDFNSACNMMKIATSLRLTDKRPEAFCRTTILTRASLGILTSH